MNSMDRQDLYILLNTLCDEERLIMIGLMGEKEWQVRDMAALMQIPAADVFRHIYEMHHVGLLNLRMDGPEDFYRINPQRIMRLKAYVSDIDSTPTPIDEETDQTWVDALDLSDEDKEVLRDYTRNGRLMQLPLKEKKWLAVLRWLVTKFEMGVQYTEKQVNALLTEAHDDYATMRRNLIEYGFMARERSGSTYWRVSQNESASQ